MKSSISSRFGWFLLGVAFSGMIVALAILIGLFVRGIEVDASASTGYSTPVEIGLLVGGAIAIVLAGIGALVALRGAKRTNQ